MSRTLITVLSFALIFNQLAFAAEPIPTPSPQSASHVAPLPDIAAKIKAAHKIYLQNAGVDADYARDMIGGANGTFNAFQSSLQSWGHFQLVPSPDQSDLIVTIRGSQTSVDSNRTDKHGDEIYYRQDLFYVTIIDPTTQSQLWAITMPAGWDTSLKSGQVAFARSIVNLTSQVKLLVGQQLSPAEVKSLKPKRSYALFYVLGGLGVIPVIVFSIRALSANKHCHAGVPCTT